MQRGRTVPVRSLVLRLHADLARGGGTFSCTNSSSAYHCMPPSSDFACARIGYLCSSSAEFAGCPEPAEDYTDCPQPQDHTVGCTGSGPDGRLPYNCSADSGYSVLCEGPAQGFTCPSPYPVQFMCHGTSYDCPNWWAFQCGVGSQSFRCERSNTLLFTCGAIGTGRSVADFNCLGAFACTADFMCSGGHVHLCTNAFRCGDTVDPAETFRCNAGGTRCNTTGTAGYDAEPIGGTNPGDFSCYGEDNAFRCQSWFNCTGLDEFICASPTPGANPFTCASQKFSCNTANGGPYVCDSVPYNA